MSRLFTDTKVRHGADLQDSQEKTRSSQSKIQNKAPSLRWNENTNPAEKEHEQEQIHIECVSIRLQTHGEGVRQSDEEEQDQALRGVRSDEHPRRKDLG